MHSYEILPIVKYWSVCHVQLINVLYTCFIATFSITRKALTSMNNTTNAISSYPDSKSCHSEVAWHWNVFVTFWKNAATKK